MIAKQNFVHCLTIYTALATCIRMIPAANSHSCEISRTTLKKVERCPETEKEWEEAAIHKNCVIFANQCGEPDKLKYHCAINPVGELVEVCAYEQNILHSYCTEYSISGNVIQGNTKRCNNFTNKPCPSNFYPSSDAYKYPKCYQDEEKTTDHQVSKLIDVTAVAPIHHSTTPNQFLFGENKVNECEPFFTVIALSVFLARICV